MLNIVVAGLAQVMELVTKLGSAAVIAFSIMVGRDLINGDETSRVNLADIANISHLVELLILFKGRCATEGEDSRRTLRYQLMNQLL